MKYFFINEWPPFAQNIEECEEVGIERWVS